MTRARRTDTGNRAHAVAAFLVGGALLATGAACHGPPKEHRPQALPQVHTTYQRAALTAMSKVPGTKLFSARLTAVSSPKPVWLTQVADPDGTIHAVRVDAIHGDFLGMSVPSGQSAQDKSRTAALLTAAKVLPAAAVDKVKEPEFGKVSDVHLQKGKQGRTVWSITIATVQGGQTHIYQVDAATAEVVDSRTIPSNSTIPSEPASPPGSPSHSPG